MINQVKKYLPLIFLIILICRPASPIFSQNLPSLDPDPQALQYSAQAQRGLSWENIAEISLWASGANPYGTVQIAGRSSTYMEIITAGVNELLNDTAFRGSSAEKGEYILEFMFRKYLRRYSFVQTKMDTLLVSGTYNCVSSGVLYLILASAAGLNAEAVITSDHAFVRLITENGVIDVETTSPYGFDPDTRREFHDEFGRLTGYSYVSARNYRDRADISRLELVSLIFNNRIAELESNGRFEEALALALNREALLSHNTGRVYPVLFIDPRAMVTDRIFNYGSLLLRQGKENEALLWAGAADRYPDPRWLEFIDVAVNNLVAKMMRSNDYDAARLLLAENRYRMSSDVYRQLGSLLDSNRVADLHNAFAAAYNRRDYLSAKEIIDRALEEFPDNRQLLADREIAERALQ